jgi:hypothetical protein
MSPTRNHVSRSALHPTLPSPKRSLALVVRLRAGRFGFAQAGRRAKRRDSLPLVGRDGVRCAAQARSRARAGFSASPRRPREVMSKNRPRRGWRAEKRKPVARALRHAGASRRANLGVSSTGSASGLAFRCRHKSRIIRSEKPTGLPG